MHWLEQEGLLHGSRKLYEGRAQAAQAALAMWAQTQERIGDKPLRVIDMVWGDLNGEPYRADQFGFMGLRLSDWLKDNWKTVMPATVFGDLGCASSVAHMALAAQWLADPANQQQTHLLLSASDDEQRSALILRGTFKA